MNINLNKINIYQNIPSTQKVLKNTVKNTSIPKEVAGLSVAALTGAVVVNHAIKQINTNNLLNNFNFNKETKDKIISAKNKNGEQLFDKKNLEILSEISQEKESGFYSYIMKNLETIDDISKKRINNQTIYQAHFRSKRGVKTASFTISNNEKRVEIMNYSDDIFYKEYSNDGTTVKEETETQLGEKDKVVYDIKKHTITRTHYNADEELEYTTETKFSKDGVINNILLEQYNQSNKTGTTKKVQNKDYIHNTIIDANFDFSCMKSQTKQYINPLTHKKETLKLEPSNIKGIYNSTIIDDTGKIISEISANKNSNGNVHIRKNLTSLDGTKTKYSYQKANNEEKSFYQIISKDGEVLTTIERSFTKLSPKKAISVLNGHKYSIEQNNNGYEITDYITNKKTNVTFMELGCEFENEKTLKDNLSADAILFLKNNDVICNLEKNPLKANFRPFSNSISSTDDIYAFSHELGHAKDIGTNYKTSTGVISENQKLKIIYEKEKKAFIEAFPEIEQKYAEYFITNSENQNGLQEVVAEANALGSSPFVTEILAERSYYLQKYFPKTIAMAINMLNGVSIA